MPVRYAVQLLEADAVAVADVAQVGEGTVDQAQVRASLAGGQLGLLLLRELRGVLGFGVQRIRVLDLELRLVLLELILQDLVLFVFPESMKEYILYCDGILRESQGRRSALSAETLLSGSGMSVGKRKSAK